MLSNYIKITLRNISKQKFYTFVNLTGLTIGIATSLLIVLYITDELSYDKFHKDADSIYRVVLNGKLGEQEFETCYSSSPLASAFVEEIPEIQSACRIAMWKDINIRFEDDTYTEKEFLLADSNFFDFFSFELVVGDPKTALKKPNSIVLTESTAKKIFGYEGSDDDSPIGKILLAKSDNWALTVTGIVKDPPHNSHFHFSTILSMASWEESRSTIWVSNNLLNYIKLNKNTDWQLVEAKFPEMVRKHVGPQVQQALGISLDTFFEQGGKYGYNLQPILDIHLHSQLDGEIEAGGNMETLYLLSIIVATLIFIACINFMNLSTARYSSRAKEVGIRKSLGGSRNTLVFQFLGESIFFSFSSMFLALIILSIIMPYFNNLSGKNLLIENLFSLQYVALMSSFALVIGILAGSYPAFYLSSFQPLEVLSGRIRAGSKSGNIRKGLVVFQFTLSMGLIICTLLIYKQLIHLQQQDLGFDKENVLIISNTDALGTKKATFKKQLANISGIKSASFSSMVPPNVVWSDIFQSVGNDNSDQGFSYFFTDENHDETMNLKIVAGRFFSNAFPSDSNAVVINETAAGLLGWEYPVGEKIRTHWKDDGSDTRDIIGVVKDYNFQSLREELTSLVIFFGDKENLMLVKLAPGNVGNQIEMIESEWKTMTPGIPFEFSFVDESFDAAFRQEQRLGKIFMIFSALAIFVACLGLFGLATFTSEQKAKEIGIRKSMGSSSWGIVGLLTKEYVKLVIVSFIVASPLAFFIMSKWLIGFAYKTDIGILVFVAGGFIGMAIAILSVSYQSIKAAVRNPVETLKYE